MKNIKEFITEAYKSDVIMTTSVFAKFLPYHNYKESDNSRILDILNDWYASYAHVMVTKCKSGAYQKPFDIRIVYSKKDGGIIFKGINKKTVIEFLLQLDSRFDSMDYDPKFSSLEVEITRDGLEEMFKDKDYWDVVEDFCDKHNL